MANHITRLQRKLGTHNTQSHIKPFRRVVRPRKMQRSLSVHVRWYNVQCTLVQCTMYNDGVRSARLGTVRHPAGEKLNEPLTAVENEWAAVNTRIVVLLALCDIWS